MKIIIRESEKKRRIFVPIPNFIVTSKWAIRKFMKHAEVAGITKAQIRTFSKEFKKIRKHFKGLLLVDVESSDGTHVKIYL